MFVLKLYIYNKFSRLRSRTGAIVFANNELIIVSPSRQCGAVRVSSILKRKKNFHARGYTLMKKRPPFMCLRKTWYRSRDFRDKNFAHIAAYQSKSNHFFPNNHSKFEKKPNDIKRSTFSHEAY